MIVHQLQLMTLLRFINSIKYHMKRLESYYIYTFKRYFKNQSELINPMLYNFDGGTISSHREFVNNECIVLIHYQYNVL